MILLIALFRAPDGRTERELREDYRAAFPRAHGGVRSRLFGRLAPRHTRRAWVDHERRHHRRLSSRVSCAPRYPRSPDYLDKYLGPAKYHFVLADRVGRRAARRRRPRSRDDGPLSPAAGQARVARSARRAPGRTRSQLTSDVSLKVKIFTVGFHNHGHAISSSRMRVTIAPGRSSRSASRSGICPSSPSVSFARRSAGRSTARAAMLRICRARQRRRMQTIFSRHTRLDVQESAIMRFLGWLASHASGDLDAQVEVEEDRFIHEGFAALRADSLPSRARWRRCVEAADSPRNKTPRSRVARGVQDPSREVSPELPRAPSLELCVLPIGGGQYTPERRVTMPASIAQPVMLLAVRDSCLWS